MKHRNSEIWSKNPNITNVVVNTKTAISYTEKSDPVAFTRPPSVYIPLSLMLQ